jgi:hypothetical protein
VWFAQFGLVGTGMIVESTGHKAVVDTVDHSNTVVAVAIGQLVRLEIGACSCSQTAHREPQFQCKELLARNRDKRSVV